MSARSPFETPRPRGIRIIQATLRVLVAVQCWGVAAAILHLRKGSDLASLFSVAWDLSSEQFVKYEQWAAYGLIIVGTLTLVRPAWPLLIPVTVFHAASAAAAVAVGEGTFIVLEPALQATMFMLPLALLLVDFWPPNVRPTLLPCLAAINMLRLATASTFAAFGVLAVHQYQSGGAFVELIQKAGQNLTQQAISAETAQRALAVIGVMDLILAVQLFTVRNRVVAAVMAVWGFATAFSWTLAYGADAYAVSLIRIADGGSPLTILLFWLTAVREQRPTILPDSQDLHDGPE